MEGNSSTSKKKQQDKKNNTSSSSSNNNSSSSSWREKVDKARKLHRPSLKDWSCDGMHLRFPSYLQYLEERRTEMAQRLGVQDGDDGEVRNACECFTTVNQYHPSHDYDQRHHDHDVDYDKKKNANDEEEAEEKKENDSSSPSTNHNLHHGRKRRYYHHHHHQHQHHVRDLPIVASSTHLTLEDFIHRCEIPSLPAIIRGIPTDPFCWTTKSTKQQQQQQQQQNKHTQNDNNNHHPHPNDNNKQTTHHWPAVHKWTLEELNQDEELRERCFKVGEDDDGRSVKLKLKHFLRYVEENKDDSPLYIFDSNFDEDRIAKKLMDHYQPPPYFNEDLFHLVGEKRRPPYRWFLLGPQRSGTTVHIDPLATSAWNTLLVGKKRWVLFPPDTAKCVVKGRGCIAKHEDDEPIHYFLDILPRMKEKAAWAKREVNRLQQQQQQQQRSSSNTNPTRITSPTSTYTSSMSMDKLQQWSNVTMYEFTQLPGETVFIPHGWWHAVLNLEHTIGITQNFCSTRNFNAVWRQTRTGRKKMAWKWLCELQTSSSSPSCHDDNGGHVVNYKELAERAKQMNHEDGFIMKYHPQQVKKREKEKAQEEKRRKKKEKKYKKKRLEQQQAQQEAQPPPLAKEKMNRVEEMNRSEKEELERKRERRRRKEEKKKKKQRREEMQDAADKDRDKGRLAAGQKNHEKERIHSPVVVQVAHCTVGRSDVDVCRASSSTRREEEEDGDEEEAHVEEVEEEDWHRRRESKRSRTVSPP